MVEKLKFGDTRFVVSGEELFGAQKQLFLDVARKVLPVVMNEIGDALPGEHRIEIVTDTPPLADPSYTRMGHRPNAQEIVTAIMDGDDAPGAHVQISHSACKGAVALTGTGAVQQAVGTVAHELYEELDTRLMAQRKVSSGEAAPGFRDPNDLGYQADPKEALLDNLAAQALSRGLGAEYVPSKYGFRLSDESPYG